MRKILFLMNLMLVVASVRAQQSLGEMKLYYAKQATTKVFEETDYAVKVEQGQLLGFSIGDNTVTIEGNNYQFEDWSVGSTPEIYTVKRSDVEVKTYTMSALPISSVGQVMNFASNDGLKARIFKSNSNGRKYIGCKSTQEANSLRNCYVVSVELISEDGSKCYVEGPVTIKSGNIILDGYFLHKWYPSSGVNNTSSYDQSGKMLKDLKNLERETDPASYCIAYVASGKALYAEGNWYYNVESTNNSEIIPQLAHGGSVDYKTQAKECSSRGDHLQAMELYERYLSSVANPTAEDYMGMAEICSALAADDKTNESEEQNALRKAEEMYAKLTEMQPEQKFYWYKRAQINMQLDPECNEERAKECYDRLIELINSSITPGNNDNAYMKRAYRFYALYYYQKKDVPNAKKWATELLKIEPDNSLGKQIMKMK